MEVEEVLHIIRMCKFVLFIASEKACDSFKRES
jgi:hypothetical protein